jgi:hypothetical protein
MRGPPAGFVMDKQTGSKMGVCAFYYPQGFTFDSAPVVIYPNFLAKQGETLEKAINRDLEHFKKEQKTTIKKGLSVKTKLGDWQIRHILNGPAPNEYETIAYVQKNQSVFILVMSSRKEADYKRYQSDFQKMIGAVDSGKKKSIFDYLKEQAKKDENTDSGKKFKTKFMEKFGQVFAGSMRKCFPPTGPAGKPFEMIAQITKEGKVTETTFNREGEDLGCLKTAIVGYVGEKPPHSPYNLIFELNFK